MLRLAPCCEPRKFFLVCQGLFVTMNADVEKHARCDCFRKAPQAMGNLMGEPVVAQRSNRIGGSLHQIANQAAPVPPNLAFAKQRQS